MKPGGGGRRGFEGKDDDEAWKGKTAKGKRERDSERGESPREEYMKAVGCTHPRRALCLRRTRHLPSSS